MKKITLLVAVAGFIAAGAVAPLQAQSAPPSAEPSPPAPPPASTLPASAFFIGLGGGFTAVNFGTQHVYAVGTSRVYEHGSLTSTGSASGPAKISMGVEPAFAPAVQLGYFRKFPGCPWLWGAKFSYTYLGTTATVRHALLPQSGANTAAGSTTPVPFTGTAVVRFYQTRYKHQLTLLPFIGRSFNKSFVYLGAGPTLSQTDLKLTNLIGFADINGATTDVSGKPTNFANSSWVIGGAVTLGATYFFNASWFVDFGYTFTITSNLTSNYSSPFTNPNGAHGSTIDGMLVGASTGRVMTHGVGVTINRAFSLSR
jgi:opacity protein-like surface antigen